jgi:hypothetical protein
MANPSPRAALIETLERLRLDFDNWLCDGENGLDVSVDLAERSLAGLAAALAALRETPADDAELVRLRDWYRRWMIERQTMAPTGAEGYCPICYHRFDQCNHCANKQAESGETPADPLTLVALVEELQKEAPTHVTILGAERYATALRTLLAWTPAAPPQAAPAPEGSQKCQGVLVEGGYWCCPACGPGHVSECLRAAAPAVPSPEMPVIEVGDMLTKQDTAEVTNVEHDANGHAWCEMEDEEYTWAEHDVVRIERAGVVLWERRP